MPASLDELGDGDVAADVGDVAEEAAAASLFELLGGGFAGAVACAVLAASEVTSLDTMELRGSRGCAAEAAADEAADAADTAETAEAADVRENWGLAPATLDAVACFEEVTVEVGTAEDELLWPSSPSPKPSTADVRPPRRPPSPPKPT